MFYFFFLSILFKHINAIRVVNGLWLLVKKCVGVQFSDHPLMIYKKHVNKFTTPMCVCFVKALFDVGPC